MSRNDFYHTFISVQIVTGFIFFQRTLNILLGG